MQVKYPRDHLEIDLESEQFENDSVSLHQYLRNQLECSGITLLDLCGFSLI